MYSSSIIDQPASLKIWQLVNNVYYKSISSRYRKAKYLTFEHTCIQIALIQKYAAFYSISYNRPMSTTAKCPSGFRMNFRLSNLFYFVVVFVDFLPTFSIHFNDHVVSDCHFCWSQQGAAESRGSAGDARPFWCLRLLVHVPPFTAVTDNSDPA